MKNLIRQDFHDISRLLEQNLRLLIIPPTALIILLTASSFSSVVASRPSCAVYFPAYDRAVISGNFTEALHDLLDELGVTPDEEGMIRLVPGLHRQNNDRLADANPMVPEVRVDPEIFQEPASGACQNLAHELAHLRHFTRDRILLQSSRLVKEDGWEGCDGVRSNATSSALTQGAYECLLDNALTTHSAAYEIEGILAQVAVSEEALRPEDYQYLATHMKEFDAGRALLNTPANEAYYLPRIKAEDEKIYRAGAAYLSTHGGWNRSHGTDR